MRQRPDTQPRVDDFVERVEAVFLLLPDNVDPPECCSFGFLNIFLKGSSHFRAEAARNMLVLLSANSLGISPISFASLDFK